MKIRNALTALALACVSLTVPAFADSDAIRVDVPFAFFAGVKKLPAGQYRLRMSESGQTLFLLGSVESSIVSVLPATVTEASPGLGFGRARRRPRDKDVHMYAAGRGVAACRCRRHQLPS